MALRRKTTNRLRLVRTCYVCGKRFSTTADSPFMRQLYNVEGKKQKTCYFCSLSCKNSTYKHKFDGLADVRRQQKERSRNPESRAEYNRRYYQEHIDQERERAKRKYYAMTKADREALNWYRRARRRTMSGGDVRGKT